MDIPHLLHVAIVDDDQSLCRSFCRLMRAAGIECVTYASAEAFLNDATPSRFDCLVLDIQLSGMSGIELGQLLAAERRPEPIIFVTAHDDATARAEAAAMGARAFFNKSDSGSDILRAIRGAAEPN